MKTLNVRISENEIVVKVESFENSKECKAEKQTATIAKDIKEFVDKFYDKYGSAMSKLAYE